MFLQVFLPVGKNILQSLLQTQHRLSQVHIQSISLAFLFTNSVIFNRRQAVLCVLAENCDEVSYKKLVQALCNEHQIPLVKVTKTTKLYSGSHYWKLFFLIAQRKFCRKSAISNFVF